MRPCGLRFVGRFNQTLGLIVYYWSVNCTPVGLEFVMSISRSRTLRLSLSLTAALLLAGCGHDTAETTGSISPRVAGNTSPAEWQQRVIALGQRYKASPNDPDIAIAYAQALRANDQQAQAAAVLQQASIRHPRNQTVLGAYGRALADTGQYSQALDVLARAHNPDSPDWRILNVQGTVLDRMGRHVEARRYYDTALKSQPNDAAILSNLGLSYALTKQLPQAERTLRLAAGQPNAEPKVRQNLALVLGLEGKTAEAENIAGGGLPPDQAQANIAELRAAVAEQKQSTAQQNPWKKLKTQKTASND
jgi:Flp pilus assembly protein TadD